MTPFRIGALLFTIAICGHAQPPGMQSGDGIWLRDAYFCEIETFDSCLAHQPGQGVYHNHVQPICLRAELEDNLVIAATGRTGNVYREKQAPCGPIRQFLAGPWTGFRSTGLMAAPTRRARQTP